MSIKAKLHTDARGNIIVNMEGGLDYENTAPLRKELSELSQENPQSTITLDMNSVDFVGSSGIGHFVETIKALNAKKDQIKLLNVKTEFLKVFKLYDFDAMEVMNMEFESDETEFLSQKYANRRRTFEN